MLAILGLIPATKQHLHGGKQLARDQGHLCPLVLDSLPNEIANVEPILQQLLEV